MYFFTYELSIGPIEILSLWWPSSLLPSSQ